MISLDGISGLLYYLEIFFNSNFNFSFLPKDTHVGTPAKEGAYIEGLYLEGARWDSDKNYIIDAEPMKLHD